MHVREITASFMALIVIGIGAYFVWKSAPGPSGGVPADAGMQPVTSAPQPIEHVDPPPVASSTLERVMNSKGFQAFISYTDNGFEPADITVKNGDTIRFTNNSKGVLHISAGAAANDAIYPGRASACDASAFDTCEALKPGDFWEFTFEKSGTWTYLNSSQKDKSGVIRVK